MSIKKIIHPLKPTEDAYGQYNFDLEKQSITNVSIVGDKELYTLFSESDVNNDNINDYPGFMWVWKDVKLKIE